jgi:hypothetical protein
MNESNEGKGRRPQVANQMISVLADKTIAHELKNNVSDKMQGMIMKKKYTKE